jgi:SAM-dependent methyltransferase
MDFNKKHHWEKVFSTKQENEVSWYQPNPETSLLLFEKYNIPKSASILEVGGGDSYLIDKLIEKGYKDVTLLDISENAIERAKKRIFDSENVKFVVSDILDFESKQKFEVWHDRASFHFLTTEEEIRRYAELAAESVYKGGYLFLGTFSENGPKKCSGLDITQYSEEKLNKVFSQDFEILNVFFEDHQTPFDTVQNFIFCEMSKK